MVGDIEKAFLNIRVQEPDRDVLRFLWVDSLTSEEPALVLYRFCRIVFGVKSKNCLAEGGFNLRKWKSNSHELLAMIQIYCATKSVVQETETRVDSLHEQSSHELHCSTNVVVEDTEMYVKTSIGQLDDGCEE